MSAKVVYEITPAHRFLIGFIVRIEAGGNYNAYWGHAASKSPDLSTMTLEQLRPWMTNRGTPQSSATGGPQFMSYTLFGKGGTDKGIVGEMGMSMDTLFTKDTQDQLCAHLLKRRGFELWAKGLLSDVAFGNNLAFEWASFPRWTSLARAGKRTVQPGETAYAGDGLNKALVTLDTMRGILSATRAALLGADAVTPSKPAEPVPEHGDELGDAPPTPPETPALDSFPDLMAWVNKELLPTLARGLVLWATKRPPTS